MSKSKDDKKNTDGHETGGHASPEPPREEPKPVTTSSTTKKNMGTLINGLLHPVTIQHGEDELQLHPKQRVQKVNGSKLGKLPNKVVFIPNK